METAAHTKAGREERARYGPRTRRGAQSEASGWTEAVKATEGHLDLTCRQGRATKGLKLGHVVICYLYLES